MTSYKSSSIDLCKTVSKLAIRIVTEEQVFLISYKVCRLTVLDKRHGVRWHWRNLKTNFSWSIVIYVKRDLQLIGGNVQMCLGQPSGIEHAIHALLRRMTLLIDARNVFKSSNRDLALKSIKKFCPSIFTAIRNSDETHQTFSLMKK